MPRKKKEVEIIDPNLPPPTRDQDRMGLKMKVKFFYDLQEMRLHAEGRLTKKAPQAPIEMHPDDLRKLRARMEELHSAEKHALKDVEDHVEANSFYQKCIAPHRKDRYKGLGPTMMGVILSSFNIERENTVSQMWSFAGLAPVPARRCRHCWAVVAPVDGAMTSEARVVVNPDYIARRDMEDYDPDTDEPLMKLITTNVEIASIYKHSKPAGSTCRFAGTQMLIDETVASAKAMRPVAGEKLKYNAWLRARLLGVLAPILLKLRSPFRVYYDNYKNRKANAGWGQSDGHRHNAAMRYMIKMLLLDIWKKWRIHEGLNARCTYQEEYLNHAHDPNDDVMLMWERAEAARVAAGLQEPSEEAERVEAEG